jgi:DNA-binding protein HU-beta
MENICHLLFLLISFFLIKEFEISHLTNHLAPCTFSHYTKTNINYNKRCPMNKTDLIKQVAIQSELTKPQASLAVDAVLESIQQALQNGDSVQLIGFGTFEVRERAAREGRNPHTGEALTIPASKVPAFKAGKALKEAVKAK